MAEPQNHSMLIQKIIKEESLYSFAQSIRTTAYDLETVFGFVLLEAPFFAANTIKDIPSQEWADEDGVDVYNSATSGVLFGKTEDEIKIGTKGTISECNSNLEKLLEFFSTRGTLFKFYIPWIGSGKSGTYFGGLSDIECFRDESNNSVLTCKVKFVVTDPKSKVTLDDRGNGTFILNVSH